jgi:hypothetical protein
MAEKKEIIGYYTDDGNIYCVDCILKTQEQIRKEIEKAITVKETEVELYFCDGCKKEIKQTDLKVSYEGGMVVNREKNRTGTKGDES